MLCTQDTFGSNIVKTYQDLRKEGFQFKRQYDPTRIPVVITNNNRTSRAQRPGGHTQSRTSTQYMVEGPGVGGEGMDDDMILAAALQASMMDNSDGDGAQVPNHNSLASHSQYQDREPYVNELPTQSGSTGSNYSVDSLNVLMNALKESLELYKSCVLNSKSDQEILSSDSFIREIVVTIQLKQSELVGPAMNFALADASEMVDDILALNDKAASMVTAFHQLNNHKISRDELMVMIRSEPESGTATEPAKSDDLLGLFDNSDTTAPVTHTQTPAASIDLLNEDDDTSFNLMHVPQPAPAAAPVVKPPLAAIPKLAPPPGSNSNQKRPSVGSSSVLLPPPPGSGATRRPSHGSSPGLTSSPGPAANSTLHDDPFHTNNTNNTSFDDTLFSTSSNSTSNTDNNATKNPFDLI